MFKQHLEMIGRNESPSKKAKFWQSYIRSLKGSEDIRAQDKPSSRRPLSSLPEFSPSFRSIYDEHAPPSERISGAGYRYNPVHRDTYGYSPRPIYEHKRPAYDGKAYDAEKAWNDHLDRMADIEKRLTAKLGLVEVRLPEKKRAPEVPNAMDSYPSRFGLYLKDKPSATVLPLSPLEYEPETKPHYGDGGRGARAGSLPPLRAGSPSAFGGRHGPLSRLARGTSLEPLLDDLFNREIPLYHSTPQPTPVKAEKWAPRQSEVAFDKEGTPIYRNAAIRNNFLNPSPHLPISAVTRDPFWWNYPSLRPAEVSLAPSKLGGGPFLRDSFLSPVKRGFLWETHPLRPMGTLIP